MSLTSTEHNGVSIVSHIRDLLPLPRHAVFHVKLVIHNLSSVPLMTGQFRVKWKFRNSQAVNSAGRPLGLGRALARKLEKRHTAGSDRAKEKGKGREVAQLDDNGEREDDPEQHEPPELGSLEPESPSPITETPTPPRANKRPASSHSSSHSSNSKPGSANASSAQYDAAAVDYHPDARGHTPFQPLSDFKVKFSQQIDVAVQMSVNRESLGLLPSELKLTIMQRVVSGDPNAPLNPRLGHVEVNLAEYVDAGSVTRNYLLRRSKVNAMLNMTITMTQISGVENYKAPVLRKEEIGAGIADFLTPTEPLPALSRFLSADDPWLADSLDLLFPHPQQQEEPPPPDTPPPPETAEEASTRRKRARWRVAKRPKSEGQGETPPPPKLAQKQQQHPTEALIEAIFNPYPTTSTVPSPFTYYVPPAQPQASDSTGTDGTSRGSFDSSRQESTSELGHETGVAGSGGGGRWWRRKTNGTDNSPVTPARSNSTRS